MKGFIVYPTYRLIDNKAVVYLFGRLENGESFLTINEYKPYFWIKKKELSVARKIVEFEEGKETAKDFKGNEVVKLIFNIPSNVTYAREKFEKKGIVCYEADIRFVYRFMIDNGIKAVMDIEGGHKKGKYVNRIYENPKLCPAEPYSIKLKTLSIDIETDSKSSKVLCISFYTDDYKKVLIVSQKKLTNAINFESEKDMLEYFSEKLNEIDPDIITGWNVIHFDLNVLKERFKYHKLPFVLGRAEWESKLRIIADFFRTSTADIAGRQVLDCKDMLRSAFIQISGYKLETAARELLGEGKLIAGDERWKEIERLYKEDQQALADYNLNDAKLVYNIIEAKDLVNLSVHRSILTGMQLDRVGSSIASLDSLYLRETKKNGMVCPTSQHEESEERIKGGFVMKPKPGIYNYIIVLDFKSLYPSIIRTFNIDPYSFDKKGTIIAPNGARFRNEDGFLPMIIEHLWRMRDVAKKKKDSATSYAIKITMNSFFGVLANPICRFYNLEIANAITAFGRKIVQDTAEIVEKIGFDVIYGDTDSIFVSTNEKSVSDAGNVGKKIERHVNEHYDNYVKKTFKRTSFLEIEYEKLYKKFIMPKLRGVEEGAKKRYAGLLVRDGNEVLDFVGLEFVRSDWTALAKEFQEEMLNRVFHEKEVQNYTISFVKELKKGKYDHLLVYRKALRKPIEEYTKTTPPHVKAAKMLDKIESNIIEYVVTEKGPEPIQKLKSKIDYEHYIEKQLKPIANSILVFFKQNFDELVSGKRQKKLFEY